MNHEEVLTFWFSDKSRWWKKDPAFDEEIRQRFLEVLTAITHDECEDWKTTAHGALAYVIVLDQFSRNMFRHSANMFANDERARSAANEAIENGFDRELNEDERSFLYMPFMHSEYLSDQERSVELFESLNALQSLDYAKQHRDIIRRFGRFPHRNALLGRRSSPEELTFLQQPGSSF